MKRILYFFSILSLALYTTSCDDKTKDETVLKVLETQLNITVKGGTGIITVECSGVLEATSNEGWCTASVQGNTVNVTVAANSELTGRTAAITLSAGDKTLKVPVTQNGTIFDVSSTSLKVSDKAGTTKILVRHDSPFSISDIAGDWLSASVIADTLFVAVETNPTLTVRKGAVKLDCGIVTVTVNVEQEKHVYTYTELLGDWELQYDDGDGGGSMDVKLEQKVANSSYTLSGFIATPGPLTSFEVKYNSANNHFIISSGQSLGTYGSYNMILVMLSTDDYVTSNTAVQYEGTPDPTQPTPTYRFADNGTWSGRTVCGFIPGAYSGTSFVGDFYEYYDVVLVKK